MSLIGMKSKSEPTKMHWQNSNVSGIKSALYTPNAKEAKRLRKQRLRTTGMYLIGGIFISVTIALAIYNDPLLLKLFSQPFWQLPFKVVVLLVSWFLCNLLPYKEGFGIKQLSWVMFTVLFGVGLADLAFNEGILSLFRAMCASAMIYAGMSFLAHNPQGVTWENIKVPMNMLCTIILSALLCRLTLLTPEMAANRLAYTASVYGGLLYFAMRIFSDTQRIVAQAKLAEEQFDPINSSLMNYMNWFCTIRIVMVIMAIFF